MRLPITLSITLSKGLPYARQPKRLELLGVALGSPRILGSNATLWGLGDILGICD